MRSEMMIGFEVAPVAPSARLVFTKSGSTESSQSLVPVAIRDCKGEVIASSFMQGLLAYAANRNHIPTRWRLTPAIKNWAIRRKQRFCADTFNHGDPSDFFDSNAYSCIEA